MPLVIPPDVTDAELCEAIANLERAELQVEIDACLDKLGR